MKNIKALVIGDLMLDYYKVGKVLGISPEAPVPVVLEQSEKYLLGGAANCALNLSKLRKDILLMGFLGSDKEGKILKDLLKDFSIKHKILFGSTPTTKKTRVISNQKQILRIDREEVLPKKESLNLLELLDNSMTSGVEYILISDYGKGAVHDISTYLKKFKNAKFLIDPKGSNWEKYKGAFLIKPNKKEYELIAGKFSKKNFAHKAERICKNLNVSNLVVTIGEKGVALFSQLEGVHFIEGKKIKVKDVTGAGDNFFAMLAYGIISGLNVFRASEKANESAAKSIKLFGNGIINQYEKVF